MFDERCVKPINKRPIGKGPVVYLIERDKRVKENRALFFAQQAAIERKQPVIVLYDIHALEKRSQRQWVFERSGLEELGQALKKKHIPFLISGPGKNAKTLLQEIKPGHIVMDLNPLREERAFRNEIAKNASIRVDLVDAHNIIPVWEASSKQEYAARTIRPKIEGLLNDFFHPLPTIKAHAFKGKKIIRGLTKKQIHALRAGLSSSELPLKSGENAAMFQLQRFLNKKLGDYAEKRNDPTAHVVSELSPYLNAGQISSLTVAQAVKKSNAQIKNKTAFLEELIVQKELSDNYCWYQRKYDKTAGFPQWALKTLKKHAGDPRIYRYSFRQFETAKTHDDIWNAAQTQLVIHGCIHGYVRMYWGKKILEWSSSATSALRTANKLNDTYAIDGRNPNGYVGISWCIGGLHDRPWGERDIVGMIRYMSYDGMKRKFDINAYISNQHP